MSLEEDIVVGQELTDDHIGSGFKDEGVVSETYGWVAEKIDSILKAKKLSVSDFRARLQEINSKRISDLGGEYPETHRILMKKIVESVVSNRTYKLRDYPAKEDLESKICITATGSVAGEGYRPGSDIDVQIYARGLDDDIVERLRKKIEIIKTGDKSDRGVNDAAIRATIKHRSGESLPEFNLWVNPVELLRQKKLLDVTTHDSNACLGVGSLISSQAECVLLYGNHEIVDDLFNEVEVGRYEGHEKAVIAQKKALKERAVDKAVIIALEGVAIHLGLMPPFHQLYDLYALTDLIDASGRMIDFRLRDLPSGYRLINDLVVGRQKHQFFSYRRKQLAQVSTHLKVGNEKKAEALLEKLYPLVPLAHRENEHNQRLWRRLKLAEEQLELIGRAVEFTRSGYQENRVRYNLYQEEKVNLMEKIGDLDLVEEIDRDIDRGGQNSLPDSIWGFYNHVDEKIRILEDKPKVSDDESSGWQHSNLDELKAIRSELLGKVTQLADDKKVETASAGLGQSALAEIARIPWRMFFVEEADDWAKKIARAGNLSKLRIESTLSKRESKEALNLIEEAALKRSTTLFNYKRSIMDLLETISQSHCRYHPLSLLRANLLEGIQDIEIHKKTQNQKPYEAVPTLVTKKGEVIKYVENFSTLPEAILFGARQEIEALTIKGSRDGIHWNMINYIKKAAKAMSHSLHELDEQSDLVNNYNPPQIDQVLELVAEEKIESKGGVGFVQTRNIFQSAFSVRTTRTEKKSARQDRLKTIIARNEIFTDPWGMACYVVGSKGKPKIVRQAIGFWAEQVIDEKDPALSQKLSFPAPARYLEFVRKIQKRLASSPKTRVIIRHPILSLGGKDSIQGEKPNFVVVESKNGELKRAVLGNIIDLCDYLFSGGGGASSGGTGQDCCRRRRRWVSLRPVQEHGLGRF